MPTSSSERALALAQGHLEAAQYMEEAHRFDDARAQFALALPLLEEAGDTTTQREVWMNVAHICRRQGALEDAREAFSHVIAFARVPGLERELATALGHLGVVEAQRGAPRDAASAWREAIELAGGLALPSMISALATNLGRLELERGAIDEAQAAFQRALAAADQADNNAERGAAYNALGEIARLRGELEEATRLFELALTFTQKTRDVSALAETYANLGNIARSAGHLQRAQRFFQTDMNMSVAIGDTPGVARAHANLGNVAAALGKTREAREHYEKGLALDRKFGQAKAMLGGHVNLANLLVVEGRFGEARTHFDAAITQLRPLRSPRTLADVLMLRGQLEARLGELAVAEATFADAREQATLAEHRSGIARIALCQAALDHARGAIARATPRYAEAMVLLEAEGVVSDIVMGLIAQAECALAAGDEALVHKTLQAARAHIAPHTAPRELLDVQALHARIELAQHALMARDGAVSTANALREAERVADALTLELAIADEGEVPEADAALAATVAETARELGLEPLQLEAESVIALYSKDLAALEAVQERAKAMALGLLEARIQRRKIAVLRALGEDARADEALASARQWAMDNGALGELARLDRAAETR